MYIICVLNQLSMINQTINLKFLSANWLSHTIRLAIRTATSSMQIVNDLYFTKTKIQ